MSFLPDWMAFWRVPPIKPMRPSTAMKQPCILNRWTHFLDNVDPPRTFKASEVAQELSYLELQSLGYESWEEVMPAILELAFEQRELGYCEILKGGKVLGEDVMHFDIVGGIRIRRVEG
jgi:hypothetical protein